MSPAPTSPGTYGAGRGEDPYYPPRASAGASRLRRLARPFERFLNLLTGRLAGSAPRVLLEPFLCASLSLLPGLGHLWVEKRIWKSLALFAVFLALLLFAAFAVASTFLWMLLFSYHAWLLSDTYARARANLGLKRLSRWGLIRSSLISTLFLGLTYLWAGQISRAHFSIVSITDARFEPFIHEGDRLIFLKKASYQRGDIVYSRRHRSFERVVAAGGDSIRVDKDTLYVNGRIPPRGFAPLSPNILSTGMLDGAELTLPPGRYCVLFPSRSYYLRGMRLMENYIVSADQLGGRLSYSYLGDWRTF
ncbi:MAG: hypothetical protein HY922_10495 [Elusimicrobia bacterium]|nr:hypothetical protein [Elusimicrobiota bacterium]